VTTGRSIEISAYNLDWPQQFENEKRALTAFFHDLDVLIHHIGSTAVPCLSAKPIIDILTEVKDIKKGDT